MPKLTKTQKQLTALGALVGIIVVVLIWVASGGGGSLNLPTYRPKTVSTDLSSEIFESAAFKRLSSPVTLPLAPGAAGRANPFEPIN